MNPVLQTIIVTLIASAISPTIVLFITRYLDREKIGGEIRNDDLEAVERYQNIAERAIARVETLENERAELEKRVADLEAATIGPFEIVLTVVTRPVPVIKSQSIRLMTSNEAKQ